MTLAIRSFFSILRRGRLAPELAARLGLELRGASLPSAPVGRPERASNGALQILSILQREGRLIDFLMEDIAPYSDEQVGAAVRSVHEQCRQALLRHVRLAPVLDAVEGTYTRLSLAATAGAIRLLGKAPASGSPEGGVLRHRGWRAVAVELPPATGDPTLIAPAEIEIE